jgi:hypothetical protein
MVRFICMLRGERRLENWIILILLFPNLWRLYSELEAVTVQVLLYSPGHGEYADSWSRHWNEGFS